MQVSRCKEIYVLWVCLSFGISLQSAMHSGLVFLRKGMQIRINVSSNTPHMDRPNKFTGKVDAASSNRDSFSLMASMKARPTTCMSCIPIICITRFIAAHDTLTAPPYYVYTSSWLTPPSLLSYRITQHKPPVYVPSELLL